MSSHVCITALFIALGFGWFRERENPATAQQPATTTFPRLVEVIPGKLKVKIFLHEIKYEKESIPCWSYVTDGLAAQQQKEIIFTIRRDRNQKPEDYPRELLELFGKILNFAEHGQYVDVGDSTLFSETGLLGDGEFRGIGYVQPEGFQGLDTEYASLLAGIVLKGDEAQIAWDFGLTRITALLGMKYRYYPCPTWSDLKRESVTSLNGMDQSMLGQIARIGIRASYYEERNHIFLSLSSTSHAKLLRFLGELPPTRPLALRTQPDSDANACLVWRPGQTQSMAITPPNSDGSRKTGAFLAFVPEQSANEIRSIEDGFALLLTNGTWQRIRRSLFSGSDVVVAPTEKTGASISIKWGRATAYTSPVTGGTYVAEKWTTYEPQGSPSATKKLIAVTSGSIVLMTAEQNIQAHTTVENLSGYLNAIENTIDMFFIPAERRLKRKVTIHLAFTVDCNEIRIVVTPNLTADDEQDLRKLLGNIVSPKVSGSVKLDYILNVWSAPGKQ
jgi:hypothetical protein